MSAENPRNKLLSLSHLQRPNIDQWPLLLLRLFGLFEELGVTNLKPVTLHYHNMSTFHIAQNSVYHERTKHIEVNCDFTCEKVMEGLLQLTYLSVCSVSQSSHQTWHVYPSQV